MSRGERRRSTLRCLPTLLLALCMAPPAMAGEPAPRPASETPEHAVIFLVRHAEKQIGPEDPALSRGGRKRAEVLARLLQDAGIDSIYSTDFKRTRDTAAPLAMRLGLEVTIYDPAKLGDLAASIKQRGGRCLVVGHSNTTPELVDLLGGEPGAAIDEESEYDRLYVITIAPDGTVVTVLLRY
ncbi:MAG: phosphoglycerate mutase family protein [Planctomycetota bacterium]